MTLIFRLMKKRKNLQRKTRQAKSKEKGTIHWKSFNFPPKRTKKLDEILQAKPENLDSQAQADKEALEKIFQKAVSLGVMEKAKPKQYFYHSEEQQEAAEREIL